MGARLLLCAALATSAVACNKVTYKNPGVMPSAQVESEKGWYFIYGLLGTHDVWADKMCPKGVAEVQSKESFLDLLIGGLTGGIITPRTYEVTCGMGG